MERAERARRARALFEGGATINEVRRALGCRRVTALELSAEAGLVVTPELIRINALVGQRARGRSRAQQVAEERVARRRARVAASVALAERATHRSARPDDIEITRCPTVYLVPFWAGRVHGLARAQMGR